MGKKPWRWHPWRNFNNTCKWRLLCSMQLKKVSKSFDHLCNILKTKFKKKFAQTCYNTLLLRLLFYTYCCFQLIPRVSVILKLPFFQSFFFKMLRSFITYPTYSKDFKDKIFFEMKLWREKKRENQNKTKEYGVSFCKRLGEINAFWKMAHSWDLVWRLA